MTSSEETAFSPCGEALSQGDVIVDMPWGLIESPLTYCRPANPKQSEGTAKYGPASAFQGGPHGSAMSKAIIHAKAEQAPAMVLWQDCQIDKFKERKQPLEKWFAGIAPMLPLGNPSIAPQDRENIRSGRRRAFFPLPAFEIGDRKVPETYVDLRFIWSVKQQLLINARIATLTEPGRKSLYAHLVLFLTRLRLHDDPTCPHCSGALEIDHFLSDVAEPGL